MNGSGDGDGDGDEWGRADEEGVALMFRRGAVACDESEMEVRLQTRLVNGRQMGFKSKEGGREGESGEARNDAFTGEQPGANACYLLATGPHADRRERRAQSPHWPSFDTSGKFRDAACMVQARSERPGRFWP